MPKDAKKTTTADEARRIIKEAGESGEPIQIDMLSFWRMEDILERLEKANEEAAAIAHRFDQSVEEARGVANWIKRLIDEWNERR